MRRVQEQGDDLGREDVGVRTEVGADEKAEKHEGEGESDHKAANYQAAQIGRCSDGGCETLSFEVWRWKSAMFQYANINRSESAYSYCNSGLEGLF